MKTNMKLLGGLVLSVLLLGGSLTHADQRSDSIKSLFAKVEKANKGPYGLNVYQTRTDRVNVAISQGPGRPPILVEIPKGRIFVAAFRSSEAEALAALDFYVGNLFTTNYTTLNNKYLLPPGASPTGLILDHAKFMASPQMAPEARSMARHMIMERFFTEKYPDSRTARGARQRGVADAENETQFYNYFVQYLGAVAASPADYLNVFEIQRRWNLTGDSERISMSALRDLVSNIYAQMSPPGTTQTSDIASAFLPLRNAIHNYMTPSIGNQLDQYIAKYQSRLGADLLLKVKTLRGMVATYYKVDRTILTKMATPLTAQMPANTAATLAGLSEKGNTPEQLETLSRLIAATRDSYWEKRNPALIHWILRANAFVQAELAARAVGDDWLTRSRIAIDGIYASGLIDRPLWVGLRDAFTTSTQSPDDMRARASNIASVIMSAHQNASTMLGSALTDWKALDLSMEGVLDDTLRGSMLTELNQVSAYLSARLPKSTTAYSIENEGVAYGYLVYIPKGSGSDRIAKLEKTAIPVFAELPLDLGVVAAIITEQPQTPLSHVSIKSKSRGTPNMYYPNASNDPVLKPLIDRRALVKISLQNGKMVIAEASLEEATAAWGVKKSRTKIEIRADLKERKIAYTADLHSTDSIRYGAKTANYGEGQRALPVAFEKGMGIPFVYYAEFIERNMFDGTRTLRQALADLVVDPRAKTDRAYLVDTLAAIQKRMRAPDMIVDAALVAELQAKLDQLYPGQAVRFRSSTNSEDLPNFSGAGLYDSYSYDPAKPNKTIAETLKKTWSSVLNLRAYDERELFEIPHMDVYMAILVSPAFKDELANGVAVTRNIVQPSLGSGHYINTQLGDEAVTNPSPDVVPEETLILAKTSSRSGGLKYLKLSSLHKDGPIMTDAEMQTLGKYLTTVHNHFKKVMDPKNKNPNFAIDAEFKLANRNGARSIYLKQARPYIGK